MRCTELLSLYMYFFPYAVDHFLGLILALIFVLLYPYIYPRGVGAYHLYVSASRSHHQLVC